MTPTAATNPEALLKSLQWRYAVKAFDPARKIPAATWDALEHALVLSPSSFGLQPWKFFVVDDPALRARLKGVSWGQTQVTDASHLVVFAARKGFGTPDIDRYVARISAVRGATVESLAPYRNMMTGALEPRGAAALDVWVARQVYIALGVFLTAAAALGVDACPMEGIDPAGYDDVLGLTAKGYQAVVVATAGYRADTDAYAKHAKVRFERSEVIEHL